MEVAVSLMSAIVLFTIINCNNCGSNLSCKYNFDCFHDFVFSVSDMGGNASQRFQILITISLIRNA